MAAELPLASAPPYACLRTRGKRCRFVACRKEGRSSRDSGLPIWECGLRRAADRRQLERGRQWLAGSGWQWRRRKLAAAGGRPFLRLALPAGANRRAGKRMTLHKRNGPPREGDKSSAGFRRCVYAEPLDRARAEAQRAKGQRDLPGLWIVSTDCRQKTRVAVCGCCASGMPAGALALQIGYAIGSDGAEGRFGWFVTVQALRVTWPLGVPGGTLALEGAEECSRVVPMNWLRNTPGSRAFRTRPVPGSVLGWSAARNGKGT